MDDLEPARASGELTSRGGSVPSMRPVTTCGSTSKPPQLAVDDLSQPVVSETGNEAGIDFVRKGNRRAEDPARRGRQRPHRLGILLPLQPPGKGKIALADYYDSKEAFHRLGNPARRCSEHPTENMLKEPVALAYAANDLGEVGNDPVCNYVLLG